MSKLIATIVGLVLLAVLVLFSTTYTVPFTAVAIQTRFGETTESSIQREPGIKFRLPIFADTITQYDTRLRLIESPVETVKTVDEQLILVKAFLLWRVESEDDGPLKYMRSFETDENAREALTDQFRSALLQLGQYRMDELIGEDSRLAEAEESIRAQLQDTLDSQGVRAEQVGLSQFLLPNDSAAAVLERMQATRNRLAQAERSSGEAEARAIEEQAENQASKIIAFAQARASEIQAAGNERAAEYLRQMGEAEDLAIFLTWLDTLEASLSRQTTLFLDARMAPFHLLRSDLDVADGQVPQPEFDPIEGIAGTDGTGRDTDDDE